MSLLVRLAHRNILRNGTRTAVALMAIAVGCAALIVNGGIVFNIFRELRDDAILGRHGHLQVYKRGYSAGEAVDATRLIEPSERRRARALLSALPDVVRTTARREFSGLVSRGDMRAPFIGAGVEPAEDADFSRHVTLRAGEPLDPGDDYAVLAGFGLARRLDARPGDGLVIMTTIDGGGLNALHVTLRGIFEGGLKEYDDWTMKVPIRAVERMLNDDRTERIVVLLRGAASVDEVRIQAEAAFAREQLGLEIRTWRDLALFHNQVVALFGRELDIIRLVIAVVVVLAIGNAVGMSIVERSVELATLRAVGLRKRVLATLLLCESLLLGLAGAAAGVVLGITIAWAASAVGITYPSPPGSTRPFVGGVDVVPLVVVEAAVMSVAASVIAAGLPIWRTLHAAIAPVLRRA